MKQNLSGRRTLSGLRRLLRRAILAALLCASPIPARAAVTWWTGTPKEAQAAAEQTNKYLVIYFESEAATDCEKMNAETWPAFKSDKLTDQTIWVRFNPKDHEKFFSYYDVFLTPEIVVLSADTKERGRVRGFVEAKMLADLLEVIVSDAAAGEKDQTKVNKVFDSRGMELKGITLEEARQARESRKANEAKRYFFFDSFDKYRSIEDLDPLVYNPYLNVVKGIRIESTEGVYRSPGLLISARSTKRLQIETDPAAVMQIDISKGLDKVDLVEGQLRVVMYSRALKLPDPAPVVAAVSVIRRGMEPPKVEKISAGKGLTYFRKLKHEQSEWAPLEIITDPFNFRQNKAYLTLWVNIWGEGFYIDDLRVELLREGAPVGGRSMADGGAPDPLQALAPASAAFDAKVDMVFQFYDKNHDERISRKEIGPAEFKNMQILKGGGWSFEKKDKNKDGFITLEEWNAVD